MQKYIGTPSDRDGAGSVFRHMPIPASLKPM